MDKKIKASMQSLTGIVIPSAWDNYGKVTAVSLSATDDENYVIENSERFFDLIHKQIKVKGLVKSGKKMHQSIMIKKCEIMDSTTVSTNLL